MVVLLVTVAILFGAISAQANPVSNFLTSAVKAVISVPAQLIVDMENIINATDEDGAIGALGATLNLPRVMLVKASHELTAAATLQQTNENIGSPGAWNEAIDSIGDNK